MPHARHAATGGCSSFALVGADGHVRAGRNYDFHPVQQVRQRLRLRPEQGRASVGMRGSVPGGRYDGVNDAGLFICLHVALSDEPASRAPACPFTCCRAWCWRPAPTRARRWTCSAACATCTPSTISSPTPAVNWPWSRPTPKPVRVAQSGTDFVAATNHYRHPDLARYQHGRRLTHSQGRLAGLFAQSAELRQAGDITPALANHDSGVCGHAGGHTTLWSLKADLTARTISYARGAPCETTYERWSGPISR